MEDQKEQDRIRRRAYELWEREGSPDGRAEEFWQRAIESLDTESSQGTEVSKRMRTALPMQRAASANASPRKAKARPESNSDLATPFQPTAPERHRKDRRGRLPDVPHGV